MKVSFPKTMRFSTLKEREDFYKNEFSFRKMAKVVPLEDLKFAVVIGRHTHIFPPKYKGDLNDVVQLDTVKKPSQLRVELLEFLPESVYYSTEGVEIAVDLDPENLKCKKCRTHTSKTFCRECFEKVRTETLQLYDYLKYRDKLITYSGRGFHIHIRDPRIIYWTKLQKKALAKEITKQGFIHDEWVCSGEKEFIRLPYTLNAVVSRICIPLTKKELEDFDLSNNLECKPSFL